MTKDGFATKIDMERQVKELSAQWIKTGSNAGTYGAEEAHRKTGTGDSRHNNYAIYTRVGDGKTRVEGCDPNVAPGRTMYTGSKELIAAQAKLRGLREQLTLKTTVDHSHSKDSDCTVDPATLCCSVCGVDHSEECPDCHQRGFHSDGCYLSDGGNYKA